MVDELIVIDFETTGVAPESGGRMTEVAAVRIQDGRIVGCYESLANCGVRIGRFIAEYTGITQTMLDGAPPAAVVMTDLLRFIGSSPVVAHNASFDRRVFDSECDHAGLRSDAEPFLCSLRLARRVYPHLPSHALQLLIAGLGIPHSDIAHRAAADASATAHLIVRICGELTSRHPHLRPNANLLRQIMCMPIAQSMTLLAEMSPEAAT